MSNLHKTAQFEEVIIQIDELVRIEKERVRAEIIRLLEKRKKEIVESQAYALPNSDILKLQYKAMVGFIDSFIKELLNE